MRWVANRARIVVNRSIPPVFSSSDVSTVTPQTITITLQGMACDRGLLVGDLRQREHHGRGERPHPDVDLKADDPDDQDRDRRQRDPVRQRHRRNWPERAP